MRSGADRSLTRLTQLGLLVALAAVLQAMETILPSPAPWLRLGLGNTLVLVALLPWGGREALWVAAGKVLLGGVLSGRLFGPSSRGGEIIQAYLCDNSSFGESGFTTQGASESSFVAVSPVDAVRIPKTLLESELGHHEDARQIFLRNISAIQTLQCAGCHDAQCQPRRFPDCRGKTGQHWQWAYLGFPETGPRFWRSDG